MARRLRSLDTEFIERLVIGLLQETEWRMLLLAVIDRPVAGYSPMPDGIANRARKAVIFTQNWKSSRIADEKRATIDQDCLELPSEGKMTPKLASIWRMPVESVS